MMSIRYYTMFTEYAVAILKVYMVYVYDDGDGKDNLR